MKNKNLIRFVESFVLFPVMTVSMPLGDVPKDSVNVVLTPKTVLSEKLNTEALGSLDLNQSSDQEAIYKKQAEAIDAYFKEHNMPLEGTGLVMAKAAVQNGLDWRLLAAIAVRESTGGKHDCKRVENNPFGWGSCRIGFDTLEKAIETVGRNLGGNNPNTAHHYEGKDTKAILQKYNPPSIVPKYADQVMAIMNDIGEKEITIEKTELVAFTQI